MTRGTGTRRAARLLSAIAGPLLGRGAIGGRTVGEGVPVGPDARGVTVALGPADLRRGVLYVGGSPEERRAGLLRLAEAVIAKGGGALFVDAAGVPGLRDAMAAIARRHGREEDLAWLDIGRAATDTDILDRLADGAPEDIVAILVGVGVDNGSYERDMWVRRSAKMLEGVVRLLCWERDALGKPFGFEEIRDGIGFKRMFDASERVYPDGPPPGIELIKAHLNSTPGFDRERGHRQPQTAQDHHGYLEMMWSKLLGDLIGRPALRGRGGIDLDDVVRGRRILAVSGGDHEERFGFGFVMSGAVVALGRESMRIGKAGGQGGLPFLVAYDRMDDGCVPLLPVLDAGGCPGAFALACGIAELPEADRRDYTAIDAAIAAFGTRVDLGPSRGPGTEASRHDGSPLPDGRPKPGAYPLDSGVPPLSWEAWLGRHAPLSLDRARRRDRIARALSAQLGSVGDNDPAIRLLVAGLLAYAAGGTVGFLGAEGFLAALGRAMRRSEPVRSAALRRLQSRYPPQPAKDSGGFATTRALAAFEAANEAGLGSGAFAWLRHHRRSLWFALNGHGRPRPHAEGLGILAHRDREREAGVAIAEPSVEAAVAALFQLSVAIEDGVADAVR